MIIFKNKELEDIIFRLEANMSNNYKDNAQSNLIEFEKKLNELCEAGKLSDKKKAYYTKILGEYKEKLKGFTHKDQKPYWT